MAYRHSHEASGVASPTNVAQRREQLAPSARRLAMLPGCSRRAFRSASTAAPRVRDRMPTERRLSFRHSRPARLRRCRNPPNSEPGADAESRSAPAKAKPSNQEAALDQIFMASTAPLMTAVSKRKRNPPIAADVTTSAILRTAMPSLDERRQPAFLRSKIGIGLVDQPHDRDETR
jgi:hypothetical protein